MIVTNKSKDPDRKTTLIIAPVALLRQWERELKTRIKPAHALAVCIHHGISRKIRSWSEFGKFDVVLTSYGLVSREFKEWGAGKNGESATGTSPFFTDAHWYRVVLDEAQYIKNKGTLSSKACAALTGEFRWCLSGTPMQNSVLELYSLLRFLRIKPYDEEAAFYSEIGNPIQRIADRTALKKLHALLKAILLRRTKTSTIDGKPILQLPERDLQIENTELTADELEFYRALEQGALAQMNTYINQGSVSRNFSNILVLLLRLRQACCHPKLIERAHRLKASKIASARSNRSALALCRRFKPRVVAKLEGTNAGVPGTGTGGAGMTSFNCPICQDAVDPVNVVLFFPCGDYICSECCGEFFEGGSSEGEEAKSCPSCNAPVNEKELVDYGIFEMVWVEGQSDGEILGSRRSRVNLGSGASMQNLADLGEAQAKTDWPPARRDGGSIGFMLGGGGMGDADTQEDEVPETDAPVVPAFTPAPAPGYNRPNTFSNNKSLVPVVSPTNKYFLATPTHSLSRAASSATLSNTFTRTATRANDFSDLFPRGWITSSKIQKCLDIIKNVHVKYPGEKVIVFSQFTGLLDFLEIALDEAVAAKTEPGAESIQTYLRYDGTMTASNRNSVITQFFDNPDMSVLLISLKAGNAGLTLTCASHVVLMDPFWNPFVEEQAMDRAHRIGQIRPVHIHRLVVPGTVEDRILELQKRKKEVVGGALDERGLKMIGKLDQKELMFLFGIKSKG